MDEAQAKLLYDVLFKKYGPLYAKRDISTDQDYDTRIVEDKLVCTDDVCVSKNCSCGFAEKWERENGKSKL